MKASIFYKFSAVLCASSAILGCQDKAEAVSGSSRVRVMNAGNEQVTACHGNPISPTRAFLFTLENPTDLYAVKRNIVETEANSSGTDVISGAPTTPAEPAGVPADYPTGATPTPLDFWLKLNPNAANKRQTVLLKFVLSDSRMRFRNDGYAISSDVVGKQMFCKLVVSADRKSATVWARYYRNPPPAKSKTFGSLNFGVDLQQSSGEYLPIFIDPMVKNEG